MGNIIDIIDRGSYVENLAHYNLQVSQDEREQVEQEEEELPSEEGLLEDIAKVEKSFCVSPPHSGQGTSSPTLQRVENLCPHFLQMNS